MRIPFLGGIGVPELIIILIVVLLIFGPKNLPKLGNAIGKTFKSMRDGMEGKKKDEASKGAKASEDADDKDTQNVIEEEAVVEPVDPEEASNDDTEAKKGDDKAADDKGASEKEPEPAK